VAAPDVPLVGGDAANVVGKLLGEVAVQVVERRAHLAGVLLIHAEDDGLGVAVGLLEKCREMLGDGFGPGAEGDDSLEVLCLVFLIGNGTAVPVQFSL